MDTRKYSTHAMRWSSDFVVAEFRNINAKSISLDYSNNFLLMPTKTLIGLKNLTKSVDDIVTIPRPSKIEPGPASWNPHVVNRYLFALASHTSVDLVAVRESELTDTATLRAHTRVITGLSWHSINPNLIASCSLDTCTHIWDIREFRKPIISLGSFASVSHVKWNSLNRHLLATVHGGDVKIWDERKPASPIQYISAHLTSIHCLDWCHFRENQICTASQDGSVKFFDINNPRKPEFFINIDSPVWRTAYTPFGRGLLVVMIPTARKSENNLLLWNISNNKVPLHTFVGHTEIVLDFQWRYFHQDGSDFQIITWSKDQTLRIWEVDRYLQELCGVEPTEVDVGCDVVDCPVSTISDRVNPLKTIDKKFYLISPDKDRDSTSSSVVSDTSDLSLKTTFEFSNKDSESNTSYRNALNEQSFMSESNTPMNLQQEFSISINIPNVQIVKTDTIRRMCCASAKYNDQIVSLLINFPPSYPRNKGPIFRFSAGTTVSNDVRCKILEALRDTADYKVKNNQACLESCLRTLSLTMQQVTSSEMEKGIFPTDVTSIDRISNFGFNQDAYFVQVRTCGAKFGFVDKLICFSKPLSQLQTSDKNICTLVNLSLHQTEVLNRLYSQNKNGTLPSRTKDMIRKSLLKRIRNSRQNKRMVFVYDVSSLFFLNKELASKYKLSGPNVSSICNHNAQVALSVGRRDLQQIWNLLSISAANSISSESDLDWECHPLGRGMLRSIINFYIAQSDIQTAATLCCVFQQHLLKSNYNNSSRKMCYQSLQNASVNIPAIASNSFSDVLPNQKYTLSSSVSDFLEEDGTSFNAIDSADVADSCEALESKTIISDYDAYNALFDNVMRAYAEILQKWQLLSIRRMIMKNVKSKNVQTDHKSKNLTECSQCKVSSSQFICSTCKSPTLLCVICRLSVKGIASVCVKCGHGGHLMHMMKWFEIENYCPFGCKCYCLMNYTRKKFEQY